uniref:Fungal lipase-like domain-containing protein n=1 Tax=Panagrolaimus davidi TaxID=227884 RepID=A0A914QYJ7_9BILA
MFLTFMALTLPLAIFGVYTDNFARNKMMPLAAAAYSELPGVCLEHAFVNASIFRQITVSCDVFEKDHCSGFTAVSHSDRAIIVAFRGSESFIQLITESTQTMFSSKVTFIGGGQVSEFLFKGFNTVWTNGMKDDVMTLKNTYYNYDIWVTGHSVGGAMASIAAATIVKTGIKPASNVILYTFGQPRTGDKAFATSHDSMGMQSYRLTHHRDMVAHVPPMNFEGYYHHEAEVWYDNDMKVGQGYIECDNADEDNNCSDSDFFTLSIDDHTHYFNRKVSTFGDDGCIDAFKNLKTHKQIGNEISYKSM